MNLQPIVKTIHIKGDWMRDGYVDNLNRHRRLEVAIDGDGAAYDVDDYGHLLHQIKIDSEGNLRAWGAGVSFSPDGGELERAAACGAVFPAR